MPVFTTMKGDTRTAIQATLSDPSGTAVDLTGASVQFRAARYGNLVINRDASVQNATGGVVTFLFQATETSTPGTYDAEFKVTYPDGSIETFPNCGGFQVVIKDDIA